MITNNSLSEIGDVLYINAQAVLNAEVKITSFIDYTFGETSDRFFIKKFKYSIDGVNYSNLMDLNIENLKQVNGFVYGFIYFEFRYERSGTDSSGILEFNNIELNGNLLLQIIENTTTIDSIFNKLSENDFFTLAIRNNILRKIYNAGILPKFIDRGFEVNDKDFVSLWGAICIFLSYHSAFAEQFDKIIFYKNTLIEYLKQSNIQINEKEIKYQHLYYIVTNFLEEIRKRGTIQTIKKYLDYNNDYVDGEWLRLICKNHYDEFLFEIVEKKNNGFYLNNSSFLYNGTNNSKQLNKTNENTDDFISLDNYYLKNNPTIVDINNKRMLSLQNSSGIGDDLLSPKTHININDLITIDEEIDYELTFNLIKTSPVSGNINIGLLTYNRNGELLSNYLQNSINNIPNNFFIKNISIENLIKLSNVEYNFRGILYSKGNYDLIDKTNFNIGNNLKIANLKNNQKVEKIMVCLYSSGEANNIFIHNLKLRPLVKGKNNKNIVNPNFIQSTTFCLNWRKNNNQEKTENDIDNFIQNYLLPYQQKIISIRLTPYTDDKQVLI